MREETQLKVYLVFVLTVVIIVTLSSYSEAAHPQHQSNSSSPGNSSSLILAAARTRRRDPLDGFRPYNHGWNITDRHYWASVGFTGVPFFVLSIVWFGGFGLCMVVFYCCHIQLNHYQIAYRVSFVMLIFFSVVAMVGIGILYTRQQKFDHHAKYVLEYVVQKANSTIDKLRGLSAYLQQTKRLGVAGFTLGPDVQTRVEDINSEINLSIGTVRHKMGKNLHDMQRILLIMQLCLITVCALMLLLIVIGFICSVFGWRSPVSIAVADSCVAVDQWVKNPELHTGLEELLLCARNGTSSETLAKGKEVSFLLLNVTNQLISKVANVDIPPSEGPLISYNQSGPLVPLLCDPFQMNSTHRKCSSHEVDFRNAPKVWHKYVCEVSPTGVCTTTGRLTPSYFSQMSVGVNVSFALYVNAPFLVQLEDCNFLREAFTFVYQHNCPVLSGNVEWMYVALAMLATSMMALLIVWIVYSQERNHILNLKHPVA